MAILSQSQWPQWLQHQWTQSSWLARLCCLLAGCAAFLAVMVWQAFMSEESNQASGATQVAAALPAHVMRIEPVAAAVTRIADWPRLQEAESISAGILSVADETGLLFERAEFSVQDLKESPSLAIQVIKLPVKGDYVQIRRFLNHVLQRYPSLALSDCSLQRNDITQTQLSAQFTLHLYVRRESQ